MSTQRRGTASPALHSIDYRKSSCAVSPTAPTGKHSIWPGPECLRTENERKADEYYAHVRAGMSPSQAYALTEIDSVIRLGDAAMRVIAIGEGRAKAAARMKRFLQWCRSNLACGDGLRFASACLSPEQAMRDATIDLFTRGYPLFVMRVGRHFDAYDRYPGRSPRAACDCYLASPEWASLPWQREEVGRG